MCIDGLQKQRQCTQYKILVFLKRVYICVIYIYRIQGKTPLGKTPLRPNPIRQNPTQTQPHSLILISGQNSTFKIILKI